MVDARVWCGVVVGLCGAVTGWVTAPYPRGVDGVSRPVVGWWVLRPCR